MKKIGLALAATAMVIGGALFPAPVMADGDVCSDPNISDELKDAAGCNTTKKADEVVNAVVNVVLSFVGIIAVCVMIYGGFLYMTSNGDSGKAQKAKNVILYGLVGMIIALLAYTIIIFVSRSISS